MSAQPDQTRHCPTCGNTVPVVARYCPSCGTRLDPAATYSADDFEDALADVLDAPAGDVPVETTIADHGIPDAPTVVPEGLPQPDTALTVSQEPEWTATASDWTTPTGQAGTWTAQASAAQSPSKPRGKRTMWIILAIVGFLMFCCCSSLFVLLIIGERDTAFTHDVSNLAMFWSGYPG